jgi:hypothetical protein
MKVNILIKIFNYLKFVSSILFYIFLINFWNFNYFKEEIDIR